MTCSLLGIIGLLKGSDYIIDVSFDILSMAALFLVPRICSVMSLNPYFGSLIPVLKEMVSMQQNLTLSIVLMPRLDESILQLPTNCYRALPWISDHVYHAGTR